MTQEHEDEPWRGRLAVAPTGGYLAIDFIKVEHEGERIEGVDRQFSHEGIIWGQRFTTSALVFTAGQDPIVLRADAALSERMATAAYPYLSASEAMMNVVGDVLLSRL